MALPSGLIFDFDPATGYSQGTQWTDQSGNGHHIVAGSGTWPASATLNGIPYLFFDGTNWLTLPNSVSINAQSFTFICDILMIGGGTQTVLGAPNAGDCLTYFLNSGIWTGTSNSGGAGINGGQKPAIMGSPQLLGIVCGTGGPRFRNGCEDTTTGSTPFDAITRAGGFLGTYGGVGGHILILNAYLGRCVAFDHALTSPELQSVSDVWFAAGRKTTFDAVYGFVLEGDSLTVGTIGTNPPTFEKSWGYQFGTLHKKMPKIYNIAASGETVATMIGEITAQVTPKFTEMGNTYTKRVAHLWGGTNDDVTDGANAATIEARVTTWTGNVLSGAAWDLRGYSNFIARGTGIRAAGVTVNAWAPGQVGTTFDVLVPVGTYLTDATDTSKYQTDAIHLVTAGDLITAELAYHTYYPLATSTVTIGTVATTTVDLSWTVPAGEGAISTVNYQIQQAPDVAGSPGSWTNFGSTTTLTSGTVTGLSANTKYWFRVIATDTPSSSIPAATSTASAQTATTAAAASGGGGGAGFGSYATYYS